MRHAGKICGVFTAGILGSLIFMAPDTFSGDALFTDLTTGSLPAATARADKAPPIPAISRQLSKIKAADDAYIGAAGALAVGGESAEYLARLEAADDAYFEAVIALETAADNARQLARMEAADEARFEARMALESGDLSGDQTGEALAQLNAADDAYFKAAMALEGNIERRRQLAELKASERTDFEAVIAQMEAVDPSATGSLPPAPGIEELDDRITTATVSTQVEDELVMEEPGEEFLSQGPDGQELTMEEPGEEFLSQGQITVASTSPVDTVASIPAKRAQGTPVPKTRAVAKKRAPKPVRSAGLGEKKKAKGPVRFLLRSIVNGLFPKPKR